MKEIKPEDLDALLAHEDESLLWLADKLLENEGWTLTNDLVNGLCFNISMMRTEVNAAKLAARAVSGRVLDCSEHTRVHEALSQVSDELE